MGGQKSKPIKTPFQQTSTYAPQSIAQTPEAKALLDVPIDVDPGAGRRADLEEQEVSQYWDSAFTMGLPSWLRDMNRNKELREVRGRGAAEAREAEDAKNRLELERRARLLPQVLQTGSSGFGTQVTAPQPGFGHSFASGLGQGIGGLASYI